MKTKFHLTTYLFSLFALCLSTTTFSEELPTTTHTIINSQSAANRLKGDHLFSLQWISWTHFGKVTISNKDDLWHISGRQDASKSDDYITLDGIITEINPRSFKFTGKIVTSVSFIKNGNPVTRSGSMTFQIKGKRKYWRLKEMQNPEDEVIDYVDIFFQKYHE